MKISPFILCLGLAVGALTTANAQLASILAPVTETAATAPRARAAAVKPATMRLGEAEIFERIAARLKNQLALDDGELSLSPVAPWSALDVPAGTWEITLLEAPDAKGLTSNFSLRFRLDAGDQQVGEWKVAVRAQYVTDVWIAARRLSRGDAPASSDLEKRRLNVLAERQSPIAGRTALDGYEVAGSVAAGQPLTWRDLAPRTLVRRGQVVSVVAAQGQFSISMQALAVQDGANGAIIKVRNLTSQRDIEAQVIGDGKVQVRF